MIRVQAIVLIWILIVMPSAVVFPQQTKCLSYQPTVVKLVGTIKRETFPGRPNYESIKTGDEPERYWILHLQQSICVLQDTAQDLDFQREDNVRKVQLVFSKRSYSEFPNVVNKVVEVTGMLFHSLTGHHHTKILLTVQDISLVR